MFSAICESYVKPLHKSFHPQNKSTTLYDAGYKNSTYHTTPICTCAHTHTHTHTQLHCRYLSNKFECSLTTLIGVLLPQCKQLWRQDGRYKEPQKEETCYCKIGYVLWADWFTQWTSLMNTDSSNKVHKILFPGNSYCYPFPTKQGGTGMIRG